MCGIIGYVGKRNAAKIIYEGLKRLEYRGYDSAGAAFICGGKTAVIKKEGKVEALAPYLNGVYANVGIGHTRWATHGKPSDINAHPHSAGEITIVHNGIIENYAELKETLLRDGVAFSSDTDSEVAAHLINKFYKGDLTEAVSQAVKMLKGSYALMAIRADENRIVAARYKSPLIIGYGGGENFCASDEPALAGICERITVLEDGDIAEITADGVNIYDGNLQLVIRGVLPNLAVSESLGLGDCPHYMLKELKEVPKSVQFTHKAFADVEEKLKTALSGVSRVIFVGCGTAYHAALIGKRYVESFARIPAEAETAGEFRYKNPVFGAGTAVFAISQSGETADTVEAARLAKSEGAKVIAVTNCLRSELTRAADVVVPVAAGPEICVAATKSYTGQVAALYLCALTLAGENADGERRKLLWEMPKLCKKVADNIDAGALAQMCACARGVYFLGRDIDYAVAVEGSLKLKEVSYLQGEGYPAGELKHGTLALIDGATVCVFILTDADLAGKTENAVEQVVSRGGKAAVITNVGGVEERLKNKAEYFIALPECDKYLSPLVSAVAVQMLAYRTAVILGRDPDKPRNLAKSVTVE
ncbi:MAG: glutamine--fructose-6-phosphate transaminase (isomerizing) [Clostridia bacterium]|nr:glutamine--fructose-6-phosphate transaminase (isomerizing) [Clostridia bacterium]